MHSPLLDYDETTRTQIVMPIISSASLRLLYVHVKSNIGFRTNHCRASKSSEGTNVRNKLLCIPYLKTREIQAGVQGINEEVFKLHRTLCKEIPELPKIPQNCLLRLLRH